MDMNRKILLVVFLFCITTFTFSQFRDREEDSKSSTQKTQQQQSVVSTLSVIMDGPVDPKEYIVGPGDVFAVSIWAASSFNFQIPVTPEGSVIIPTVNEIKISGLTLDSAKRIVIAEIKKKYISGPASFTLYTPRTLIVTVKGAVPEEGKQFVQATNRVDIVVNYRKNDRDPIDTTIAQRNILLYHKDGSRQMVDIEKYYATGNTIYNPLLRDGDMVVVPQRSINQNFISIYGAVNKQGSYEFAEGDSVLIMLKIARGLTKIADSGRIVITRYSNENSPQSFTIDVRKILLGIEPDIPLQRGDRIVVFEQYIQNNSASVIVTGEVKYPGRYPITNDSTYLSEIIKLAGGTTQFSSLNNSQLHRHSVNAADIFIERLESGRGGIISVDSAYYYLETDIRLYRELVVVDFIEILEKENSSKDILLRDQDVIHIASKKKSVYVFGQVVSPGHIAFSPNKDINYYIAFSGGLTDDARSDIKVIKATTRQWLDPNKTKIEEGDYIWVPKEPYRPFSFYVTVYSQVFGIVGTIATLFLLITK